MVVNHGAQCFIINVELLLELLDLRLEIINLTLHVFFALSQMILSPVQNSELIALLLYLFLGLLLLVSDLSLEVLEYLLDANSALASRHVALRVRVAQLNAALGVWAYEAEALEQNPMMARDSPIKLFR